MSVPRVTLFHRITEGMRISARPQFLREQSSPAQGRFVFTYHIRIENCGARAAQLLRRHWHIHDEGAGKSEVEGEGVVGAQPHLAPGEVHEYSSFCVLTSPRGWMEGTYHFVREDGSTFEAAIPRFTLAAVPGTGRTTPGEG